MASILDISPLLSPRMAVWPGDTPFSREVHTRVCQGDPSNLSTLHTTSHAGAHADAPSHVLVGAATVEHLPLEPFIGPCHVVRVSLPPGTTVLPDHLPCPLLAPRLLIRTDSFPAEHQFTEDYNALSPELIPWLVAQGCVLVGIDTPSVDPFASTHLEAHRALFQAGLQCLEGLRLSDVDPGCYDLVALPLRIEGGDGSPVRAILRRMG